MLAAVGWLVLGSGSAAAVAYGVRRHRPARSGPWLLLSGALAVSTAGDVLTALGRPGVANGPFYVMFALVVWALVRLTRAGPATLPRPHGPRNRPRGRPARAVDVSSAPRRRPLDGMSS